MFAPPVPVADVQVTALCEVAANPAQFAGRPVTVRGTVAQASPEDLPSLSDESCGRAMGLAGVPSEDAERLRQSAGHPAYVTVTATIAFARCAGRLGAGTGCGAYLRVSRVDVATIQTAQR